MDYIYEDVLYTDFEDLYAIYSTGHDIDQYEAYEMYGNV